MSWLINKIQRPLYHGNRVQLNSGPYLEISELSDKPVEAGSRSKRAWSV